jgi:hypothetical protein
MKNQNTMPTEVAYVKGHNMSDKIKSDEIVIHATNLLTQETYHWIYPKSKMDELSKVDLGAHAMLIAKQMEIATTMSGQEEMDYMHVAGKTVAEYINSSQTYKMSSLMGQNAYYVAVEYTPNGDTCCRILGAGNMETVTESTSTGLAKVIGMSKASGHVKIHSSRNRYTIMLDKLTPGTRTSYGPAFTPSYAPATSTKVGRNTPCPCGSGKKSKKCCK